MSCLINPNAQRLLSTLNPTINLFLTKHFFYYLFFKLNTYLIFINFLFIFLNKFNYNNFFLFWFNNFKIINFNLIIYFSKKLNFFIKKDDEDAKNQSLIQLHLRKIKSPNLDKQTFNDFNDIVNSKIATFLVNWAKNHVVKEKETFTEVDKERAEKAKFDFRKIRFFYSFFSKKKFYFLTRNLHVPWTYWFLVYQKSNPKKLIKVYKKKHYTYRNYWAKTKIARFHPALHFLYSSLNLSTRKSWFNLRKFTKPHNFKLKRFTRHRKRNELVVNRLNFFQHYKTAWKKPFFFLPKKFWRKWWNNWFVKRNYWTFFTELQFYLKKRHNLYKKNIRGWLAYHFYMLWLKNTKKERFGLRSLKTNSTITNLPKYKLLSWNLRKKTQYYKKLWKQKEFKYLNPLLNKNSGKLKRKSLPKKILVRKKIFYLYIKKKKLKLNITTFFKQKIFHKLQKKINLTPQNKKQTLQFKAKNLLFLKLFKFKSHWKTKFIFNFFQKKTSNLFTYTFFWNLLTLLLNQRYLKNIKILDYLFFKIPMLNLNLIILKKKFNKNLVKQNFNKMKNAIYKNSFKKIINSLAKKKKKKLIKKFNKKILKTRDNFINFLFINFRIFKKKPHYVTLLEINLTNLIFFSFVFFPILSFYKSLFAHILHLIFPINKFNSNVLDFTNKFFKKKKTFWKINFLTVRSYYYSKFSILKFIFFKLRHRRLKVRIFLDQIEKFFAKRTNNFKNNYIKHSLMRRKKNRQKRFFGIQKKNNQALLGYRMHLSGRITKKDRALYIWESRGKNSLSSQFTKVEYITKSFITPYSLCTLKLWLRWF